MIKADIFDEKEIRSEIIELALKQYNKLYIHGKKGPYTFDCAGFVWFLYNKVLDINIFYNGIGKSTTTKIMTGYYGSLRLYDEKSLNKDLKLIKPGDVLLFHTQSKEDNNPTRFNKYPGHCGLYLSDNIFLHCSNKKGGVVLDNFDDNNKKWRKKIIASKDIASDIKVLKKIK